MNVIVGNINDQMREFIKKYKFTSPTIIINKMCNVKHLTDPINLFIPFNRINRAGLIDSTMVHLEELLISANVIRVYFGVDEDSEKYEILSKRYNVPANYIMTK